VIRHADTLICLQWYVLVLALRRSVYTLFVKNKIKFWEKIFCIPKNMVSRTIMLSLYNDNHFIVGWVGKRLARQQRYFRRWPTTQHTPAAHRGVHCKNQKLSLEVELTAPC